MDNQNLEQIVESSGSSVIVESPKADSDQAGMMMQRAAEKQKRSKLYRLDQKWQGMSKGKRRGIVIGLVVVIVTTFGGVVFVASLTAIKISYRDSYLVARELKESIQKMRSDYDCQKVVDYVDSAYTTMGSFLDYVDGCKTIGDDSGGVVIDLGKTEGVQKDEDLAAKYDSFNAAYEEVVSGGTDLADTLDLYTVWHKWVIASTKVEGWDQTDAELTTVAEILMDSGDEVLASYGEEWLGRRKAAAKAYRDYYVAGYDSDKKEDLRKDMNLKQKEFTDFEAEKRPDIKDLKVLETADTAKLYARFEEMYNYIRTVYQSHYKRGTGDCKELLVEIVCD